MHAFQSWPFASTYSVLAYSSSLICMVLKPLSEKCLVCRRRRAFLLAHEYNSHLTSQEKSKCGTFRTEHASRHWSNRKMLIGMQLSFLQVLQRMAKRVCFLRLHDFLFCKQTWACMYTQVWMMKASNVHAKPLAHVYLYPYAYWCAVSIYLKLWVYRRQEITGMTMYQHEEKRFFAACSWDRKITGAYFYLFVLHMKAWLLVSWLTPPLLSRGKNKMFDVSEQV